MRILITGAAGQLGEEWEEYCESNEMDFAAFTSKELDITNEEEVKSTINQIRPNVIVNCAAYTKVDDAEDFPEKAEAINAKAVKFLAEICAKKNIKLVHYSTDYVFKGDELDKALLPNGYAEDHKVDPINEYGRTKWLGEKAIIESGCTFLLIRISWLCGIYGHNFVKTMLKLGAENEELNIVSDQYGSPTFTDELVSISHQLLVRKQEGIFHVSSEGITNWSNFAKQIFLFSGLDVKVNEVSSKEFPTKAVRPKFSKLCTKKLNKTMDIRTDSWKEGLQRLLNQL